MKLKKYFHFGRNEYWYLDVIHTLYIKYFFFHLPILSIFTKYDPMYSEAAWFLQTLNLSVVFRPLNFQVDYLWSSGVQRGLVGTVTVRTPSGQLFMAGTRLFNSLFAQPSRRETVSDSVWNSHKTHEPTMHCSLPRIHMTCGDPPVYI